MSKKMFIDAAHPEETRVAVIANKKVEDFDFESLSRKPLRGNIYLARVTRVEPSLQAAFVEYGGNRHGFLAFSEIHPDYYQIPVADREKLREAEELEAELAAQIAAEEEERAEAEALAAKEAKKAAKTKSPANENEQDSDEDIVAETEAAPSDEHEQSEAITSAEAVEVSDVDTVEDADKHEIEMEIVTLEEEEFDESDDTDNNSNLIEIADAPIIVEEIGDDQDEDDDSEDEEAVRRASLLSDAAEEQSLELSDDDNEDDDHVEEERELTLEERYRQARRERTRLLKNYKIQEVIKRRQILLIQVVKEERGNKGAALTTYISLAGRYCVLMPNTSRGGGVSRKINNGADRKRLRKAMADFDIPQGMGLIIRTAGAKRTKVEIKRDYDYLLRLWETIRDLTLKSIAPCLIYEEASLIKRVIRDLYDKETKMILVEGEEGYREAKNFMKMLMPSHAKNVQPYKGQVPLFQGAGIENQLDEMYQPVVKLRSGGYLVIQQTEALISIDVNSGKATKERNIEATALKTNLEAAAEVARQCRLRDLAGLVVVDFIDMEENRNNRAVEKKLKDAMKTDRARIQLGRISSFGLLELSRQRRRSGIVDGTTSQCPTCQGSGAVRSHEMAALRILRAIEEDAVKSKVANISASTSIEVALFILNNKRDWLVRIEESYGITILVEADSSKAGDQYSIEKHGPSREKPNKPQVVTADLIDLIDTDSEEDNNSTKDDSDDKPRKKRRRPRRKNTAKTVQDSPETDIDGDEGSTETAEERDQKQAQDNETVDDGDDSKKKRRRGRRGGRRNRKKTTEDTSNDDHLEADPAKSPADQPKSEDEKPKRRRRKPSAKKTKTDDKGDASDQPDKNKPIAAKDSAEDTPRESKSSQQKKSPTKKVAATAPQEDAKTTTSEENKPRRGGWWQRALGRG
ncbi:MAG: Rne/Rng family ribonuclease [bacterium]